MQFVEETALNYENRLKESLKSLCPTLIYLAVLPHQFDVRREALKVCQRLLSTICEVDFFQYLMTSLKEAYGKYEIPSDSNDTNEASENASKSLNVKALIKLAKTACQTASTVANNNATKNLINSFLALHVPIIHRETPRLWIEYLKSLMDQSKLDVFLRTKTSEFCCLIFEEEHNLPLQCNCLKTLAIFFPDNFLDRFISKINNIMANSDFKTVTVEEYEIFKTPEGQLWDYSVVEAKKDDISAKNLKRESKLYSYKEQLAEMEIRREIEKKKMKSNPDKEPPLNEKQLAAKKIQLEKESMIREFVKVPNHSEFSINIYPKSLQPYLKLMRFHSPTGGWLLLFPGYLSLLLAASPGSFPHPSYIFFFGLGTFIMRGVGCTVNDIVDRKIDRQVERTKNRPIASGQISIPKALMFLGAQSSAALYILTRFDPNTIILGLSSLGLVALYPFTKKFTYWPQLVLGLTFNWGALMGWSAITKGNIFLPGAVPLYLGCVCWTLVYDTIYAHQDKNDDMSIGVKSTAIKFGEQTKSWLRLFTLGMMSNLGVCGYMTDQLWPYYFAILGTGYKMHSIISTLDINDPENCSEKFTENLQVGWILLLGFVLSNLLKKPKHDDLDSDLYADNKRNEINN
ncbi:ubiquinone biosynthesis protein COQ2, mitochondrial [Brevipalpus obovatus]|uniref:ubiquinone biosynthesis protein COQ2, mitochondrial n=1 Tax=Brevipalpus obovatus TaxID=246614 RepID=UPI003D9FAB01